MKYRSAFQKKEILSNVMTQMNLQDTVLSDKPEGQTIIFASKIISLTEAESRMVVARDRGEEKMGSCSV